MRQEFLTTLKFWADRGVDGFRIDVAHALAKDLTEPLASQADLDADIWGGAHPLQDRDEVHDIYREWRRLFNQYDPPRTAVAEAWVPAHRRSRYASPDGLGQAFNFDLLEARWDATTFAAIIDKNLELARESGASSTWVLSNHDVVRHATRYALPEGTDLNAWLLHDGAEPRPDEERGRRRARAATLLTLALPGSAYLYQGEELGLPEVADLPADALQDPTFLRSGGEQKGRDGCRVPLPWATHGPTLGFGDQLAHLPVPADFGRFAVETPGGRRGLHPELLPAGPGRAAAPADRRDAGVAHAHAPDGRRLHATRRLDVRHQLRELAGADAGRPGGRVELSARRPRGARGDHRLAPAGRDTLTARGPRHPRSR